MQYLWHHLENILDTYDGKLPLHHFLKAYFKSHPKLGSRDRRGLIDAVYSWYRAGKGLESNTNDVQTRRLAAMHLCGLSPKAFSSFFPESWQSTDDLTSHGISLQIENIFPSNIPLSPGISIDEYRESMLRQPRMFLRIRKDKSAVTKRLSDNGIPHEWITDQCLALPNGTKLDGLLPEDTYVVQDASSQSTGQYLNAKREDSWWDTCAGAGGKSLMLVDKNPGVFLLTTDIRPSILENLSERFMQYSLRLPERQVLDAANPNEVVAELGDRTFQGIICDVPCSGSGTWARTPEGCYFFQPDTLEIYSNRQKAILSSASVRIAARGKLIYITCSVFRAENEDVVEAVSKEKGLIIQSSKLINGIAIGADSLYVAVLTKA